MKWLIIWNCCDSKTGRILDFLTDEFEGNVSDFRKYLEGGPSSSAIEKAKKSFLKGIDICYLPQCLSRLPNVIK